jgi:hypothetical protein
MSEFLTLSTKDLDQSFGFRISQIERDLLTAARALRPLGSIANFGSVLHQGHQTWIGLDPDSLSTPYSELFEICELLNLSPGDMVVDLGAGYGKLGLVLHKNHPEVRFQGFELVRERVEEGKRVLALQGCLRAELFIQDLMNPGFITPVASHYFLYDFGKTEHIRKILNQLEKLADSQHRFKVIARGKGSRSIIEFEHPWLSGINDVLVRENYSIYSF